MGTVNESSAVGEWEQESGERTQMIVARWLGKSWKRTEGFGDGGDNGWGYGLGPSECSGGIGRRDIDFSNGQDDGKSGMLGGSVGGWKEGEPENVPQSTRTRLVGGHVPRRIPRGRRRPRRWRRKRRRWKGR